MDNNLLEPHCVSMDFKNIPPEFQKCVNKCTEGIEDSFVFFDHLTVASMDKEGNLNALR